MSAQGYERLSRIAGEGLSDKDPVHVLSMKAVEGTGEVGDGGWVRFIGALDRGQDVECSASGITVSAGLVVVLTDGTEHVLPYEKERTTDSTGQFVFQFPLPAGLLLRTSVKFYFEARCADGTHVGSASVEVEKLDKGTVFPAFLTKALTLPVGLRDECCSPGFVPKYDIHECEKPPEEAAVEADCRVGVPAPVGFREVFSRYSLLAPSSERVDFEKVYYGAEVVWEQEWELVGFTRGDLVLTLPLAPLEQARITVESALRTTRSRILEGEIEVTRTNESTVTQRDSAEFLRELHSKSATTWEASGGVDAGFVGDLFGIGGSLSVTVSGTTETEAHEQARVERFHEEIHKASERVKKGQRTRVEIGSESEQTDSTTRLIRNLNRCYPIVYKYYQLLRHWKVRTRLREIRPVVFAPHHDWRYWTKNLFTLGGPKTDFGELDLGIVNYATFLERVLCREAVIRLVLLDYSLTAAFDSIRRILVAARGPHLRLVERLSNAVQNIANQNVPDGSGALFDLTSYNKWDNYGYSYSEDHPGDGKPTTWRSLNGVQYLHVLFRHHGGVYSLRERMKTAVESGIHPAAALRAFVISFRELLATDQVLNAALTYTGATDGTVQVVRTGFDKARFMYHPTRAIAAELFDTVVAAADSLGISLSPPESDNGQGAVSDPAASKPSYSAEDVIRVEKLLCHLKEHSMHYLQAIWASEGEETRRVRHSYVGVVGSAPEEELPEYWNDPQLALSQIAGAELLGFFGAFAIHPYIQEPSGDHASFLKRLDKSSAKVDWEDCVTVPVPGSLIEGQTAECSSCDDVSRKHNRVLLDRDEKINDLVAKVNEDDIADVIRALVNRGAGCSCSDSMAALAIRSSVGEGEF